MKDYRTTQKYQKTTRDILGPIHIGFGVLTLGLYAGLQSCDQPSPKESFPDRVSVEAYNLLYEISFSCTWEQV